MEEMRLAYEEKLRALRGGTDSACVSIAPQREFLKKQEEYLNEYVEVKLFKDNDRYRDDVYVAVNGQNCIIKRGEWVRIKRKFALVLDASEIQDMKTGEFMEREQSRFMNESSAR